VRLNNQVQFSNANLGPVGAVINPEGTEEHTPRFATTSPGANLKFEQSDWPWISLELSS
jgi:hypothetical protein